MRASSRCPRDQCAGGKSVLRHRVRGEHAVRFGATRFRLRVDAASFRRDERHQRLVCGGDRTSESPLRDLALNIPSAAGNSAAFSSTEIVPLTALRAPSTGAPETTNVTQAFDRSLMRNEAHFAAPFQSNDDVTVIPSSALLTANYQPVAPVAAISPAPGTLAFDSVPAATQSATLAPLTVHLGGAQFEGNVQGGSSDTPALSLHDSTYGAGANLQLRAGKRDINLNLTTQYEQLLRNDNSGFAAAVGS